MNLQPVKQQLYDQFAIRSTGSTTAALIAIIHQIHVTTLLETNESVTNILGLFESIQYGETCYPGHKIGYPICCRNAQMTRTLLLELVDVMIFLLNWTIFLIGQQVIIFD